MASVVNRKRGQQALMHKIEALPLERQVEVEDFVDFIVMKNDASRASKRALTHAATAASAAAFATFWSNPEDDVYDVA